MYLSEEREFKNFSDPSSLFWFKPGIIYGDWYSGPSGDGSYSKPTTIIPSEVKQNY